jgi:hypothetical protein
VPPPSASFITRRERAVPASVGTRRGLGQPDTPLRDGPQRSFPDFKLPRTSRGLLFVGLTATALIAVVCARTLLAPSPVSVTPPVIVASEPTHEAVPARVPAPPIEAPAPVAPPPVVAAAAPSAVHPAAAATKSARPRRAPKATRDDVL